MTMPDDTLLPGTAELCRWVLGGGTELRTLRASLHQALTDLGLIGDRGGAADVADDVVLVATELATNALQHASPPTTVRLLRDETRFIVDVIDHDPDTVPQIVAASLSRSRGRGLYLAHAVAEQVGWGVTGSAKHVWACFPICSS